MGIMDWFKKKHKIPEIPEIKEIKEIPKELAERDGRGHVLSYEDQMDVVRMIGDFGTDKQIMESMSSIGKPINQSTVQYYRRTDKYKALVAQYRALYTQALMEVPLSNKRKRVEEYSKLFEKVCDKYEKTSNSTDAKAAGELLSKIQGEIEGQAQGNTYIQNNLYSNMKLEDIQAKRLEAWERLEKIKERKNAIELKVIK